MALHITRGSGAPVAAPTQIGEHYVDTTNKIHYLSVGLSTPSDWVQVGSGSSAISFLNLTDTPSTYAGSANKQLYVNSNATGVDFRVPPTPGATNFLGLTDTPTTYAGQGGKRVQVNAAQTALEFVPAGSASLPPGGTTGQSLTKVSSVDGDADWADTVHQIPQHNAYYVDSTNGADTLIPKRGQLELPFQTIKACCDYIATLPLGDVYAIRLQPGTYPEMPFTIPPRTCLSGIDFWKTILVPLVEAGSFITLTPYGNIANFVVEGNVGGVGPKVDVAIHYPYAEPYSVTQISVNNAKIGIKIDDGNPTVNVQIPMVSTSFGDLGPCDIAIQIAGNANIGLNTVYGVGTGLPGSIAINMLGGIYFHVGGKFLGYETAIRCTLGTLNITSLVFQDCVSALDLGTLARLDSRDVSAKVIGCVFRSSAGFLGETQAIYSKGLTLLAIVGSTFEGYNFCVNAQDESLVTIDSCAFRSKPTEGTIAVAGYDSSRVRISNSTFTSDPLLLSSLAVDCTDSCLMDVYSCLFSGYKTGAIADGLSQLQCWNCGFENYAAIPDPNSIGLIVDEEGFAFIYSSYFIYGTGIIAQADSLCQLYTVGLGYSDVHFQQKDLAIIINSMCEFNEDKVLVEDWSLVGGVFISSKQGDRGLFLTDKLKVGVPEYGQLSAQGQGNSFSRGMLVYEFNSVTDLYTDVSDIAKEPEGDFGIPTVQPDSAIYFGCTLADPVTGPIKFYGLYLSQSVQAELGLGSVIGEYWDGAGWARIGVMMTYGQPPYSITQIDQVAAGSKTNLRFSDQLALLWAKSDPIVPPLGKEYYWFRVRVASNWADANWQYRIKATIPAAQVVGTVTNFQCYMDLSNIASTSFWANVKVDGGDIRITTSDGVTQLPVELVSFNRTAKTGSLYYTAPSLTNAAPDYFYIYYGNPAADQPPALDLYGSTRVWRDYDAVYHMGGSGQNYTDSTVNGFTGSGTRMTRTSTGKFGDQTQTDNTSGSGIFLPNVPVLTQVGRILTYDAWFRCTATQSQIQTIISLPNTNTAKNDFFAMSISTGGVLQYEFNTVITSSAQNVVSATVYNLATYSYDGQTQTTNNTRGYLNGVQRANTSNTISIPTGLQVGITNRGASSGYMVGQADEIRIARVFRALNWHQTLYNNMNTNNLWQTFGAQEDQATAPGSNPILVAPRWSQSKLWPSSSVLNPDGYPEYFGNARQIRKAFPAIVDFNSGTGTDYAAVGGQVWLSQEFGVLSRYSFTAAGTKRITSMYRFGNDADISCPIRIRLKFIPRTANTGDVLLKLILGVGNELTQYYTTVSAAPLTAENQTEVLSILSVDSTQLNKEVEKIFVMPWPVKTRRLSSTSQAETIWISIMRLGDSALDTYTGAMDMTTLDILATNWRLGAHIEF